MPIEDEIIKKGYNCLDLARKSCFDFYKITKKHVSIRGIEDRFGEYLIANKLVTNGLKIKKISGRGVDIITDSNIKIEVKTSRLTKRFNFKGAKKGYSWVVKNKQWTNKEYDYLACVLADKEEDNILVFTYEESIRNFSHCSFVRSDTKTKEENCLCLDLTEGDDKNRFQNWENNLRIAREKIEYQGEPTTFELDFNKNPDKYFKEFSFDRFLSFLKNVKIE